MKYIIVGFGNIGHKRKSVLGKKCLATVDPNPDSGADYRNVLDIPDKIIRKVGAVVITIPRDEKLAAIKFWMNQKKHVLVEKPLFISENEGRELQQIAKKNQVIWYTAYNYRFEPHIKTIKKLLDQNFLGRIYHGRMVYGFGNVAQLKGTWREIGSGVIEEISCHLIDFADFLLGYNPNNIESLTLDKLESKTIDHAILITKDKKIAMEASWTHWKNAFSIELYGEKGSLHLDGLCKWGESILLVRKRILPAGVPKEKRLVTGGQPFDPTWSEDIKQFEKLAKDGVTSFKNDLKITQALVSMLLSAKTCKTREAAFKLLRGSKPI